MEGGPAAAHCKFRGWICKCMSEHWSQPWCCSAGRAQQGHYLIYLITLSVREFGKSSNYLILEALSVGCWNGLSMDQIPQSHLRLHWTSWKCICEPTIARSLHYSWLKLRSLMVWISITFLNLASRVHISCVGHSRQPKEVVLWFQRPASGEWHRYQDFILLKQRISCDIRLQRKNFLEDRQRRAGVGIFFDLRRPCKRCTLYT